MLVVWEEKVGKEKDMAHKSSTYYGNTTRKSKTGEKAWATTTRTEYVSNKAVRTPTMLLHQPVLTTCFIGRQERITGSRKHERYVV
jgi:hypothetical protein